MPDFERSVNIVLKHEGGYSHIMEDSGGITKYGISSAQYPGLDIANLTLNDAKAIYERDYWRKFRLNELTNQYIADLALDMTVLHGQAVKLIQYALRDSGQAVTVDNIMGSQTITALNKVAPDSFINNAVKRRKEYMVKLANDNPKNQKFLAGWIRRADFFLHPTLAVGTTMAFASAIAVGVIVYLIWPTLKRKLS